MASIEVDSSSGTKSLLQLLAVGGSLLAAFTGLAYLFPLSSVPYASVDFHVYYAAASALTHGANPYVLENLRAFAPAGAINEVLAYSYPPLLAEVVIPLTALGTERAARVWLGFNLFAPAASTLLMLQATRWRPRPLTLAALLLGALLFIPCLYTYLSGQASLWSLLWASFALYLSERRLAGASGGAWALAWAKPHPLLLMPIWLLQSGRRALLVFGAITLLSLVAVVAFLPEWVTAMTRSLASNNAGEEVFYQATLLWPLGLLGAAGTALRGVALAAGAILAWWLMQRPVGWKPKTVGLIMASLAAAPYLGRSDIALALIPIGILLSEARRAPIPARLAVAAWAAPLACFGAAAATGWRWLMLPVVWSSATLMLLAIASISYILQSQQRRELPAPLAEPGTLHPDRA